MTDPMTTILGGALIASVAGAIGKYIGDNGKVSEDHCNEKRKSCQKLLLEKVSNIDEKVDTLTKAVNNKLFGL